MAGLLLIGCTDAAPPSVPGASLGTPAVTELPTGSPDSESPSPMTPTGGPDDLRYVALGDSYTIGVGVKLRERWPNQLVRVLRPDERVTVIANLAANGATSRDVIEQQLAALAGLEPQFVSLLVGVNDVVRHVDPELYRLNLGIIFDAVLKVVPADRILVVTTPDYTLTPHGADYGDPVQQSTQIANLNALLIVEAASRGITVVDITPVSRRVPEDPGLLARDELHPSGKQYAGWVELIAPVVRGLLAEVR